MNKVHIDNLRFQYIIPAYELSPSNITNVISRLPLTTKLPLVIYNDDPESPTFAQIRELELKGKLTSLIIPFQVGKAEAIRHGLEETLKDKNIDVIIQVDGRQKQPPEDIEFLISSLQKLDFDMVIANRYGFQDISNKLHRATISSSLSAIVQALTGISVPDAVCGTRGYRVQLASKFLKLRSFGYGLEVEQLIIAGLTGARVSSVPIHSKPQDNFTLAEKIEDNLMTIISYSAELKMSNGAKAALCRILAKIKKRNNFICDLSLLGISKLISAHVVSLQAGHGYTLSSIASEENISSKQIHSIP